MKKNGTRSNAFMPALVVLFTSLFSLVHTTQQGVAGKWTKKGAGSATTIATVVATSGKDSVRKLTPKQLPIITGDVVHLIWYVMP